MRVRWGKIRWGVARWWGRLTGAPISIDDRTHSASWDDEATRTDAGWDDEATRTGASWDNEATRTDASWDDEVTRTDASWDDVRTYTLRSFAMTKTGVKLKNFVIGDSKRLRRTFQDLPEGYTVATAYLTIKKSAQQADSQAIVQNAITTSSGAAGQITDALTAGGSIAMFFDLSKTDTAVFRAGEYVFDIQVVLSGGEVHTMEIGTIDWIYGVTAASS